MHTIGKGARGDGNFACCNICCSKCYRSNFKAVIVEANYIAYIKARRIKSDVESGGIIAGNVIGIGSTSIGTGLQINPRWCRRNS